MDSFSNQKIVFLSDPLIPTLNSEILIAFDISSRTRILMRGESLGLFLSLGFHKRDIIFYQLDLYLYSNG